MHSARRELMSYDHRGLRRKTYVQQLGGILGDTGLVKQTAMSYRRSPIVRTRRLKEPTTRR